MNAYLNINTNLAVFSFPNAFLSFKKQERKTKKSRHVAVPETPIYNYTKYVHISFFLL